MSDTIWDIIHSVANTVAKPQNWATFDPVLTTKNGEKQVRCGLAKFLLATLAKIDSVNKTSYNVYYRACKYSTEI